MNLQISVSREDLDKYHSEYLLMGSVPPLCKGHAYISCDSDDFAPQQKNFVLR